MDKLKGFFDFDKKDKAPLCACGCGRYVTRDYFDKKWNTYITGHNDKTSLPLIPKDQKPPLCACGCGNSVKKHPGGKKWYTYLKGHYNKCHPKTLEQRKKLSKSLKGRQTWNKGIPWSIESKQKMSESHKGKRHTEQAKEKCRIASASRKHSQKTKDYLRKINLGKRHTKESKIKMSKAHKGLRHTEETKKKISESEKGHPGYMLGKHHTKEAKQKLSASLRKVVHTPEWNRKVSESQKGKIISPEAIEKMRKALTGRKQSKETIEKRKRTLQRFWTDPNNYEWLRELWKDPEWKSEQLKKMCICNGGMTSRPEKELKKILRSLFHKTYKHVGKGKFWIGGRNPDFLDKKNKKIIELFGDYWHGERRTGKTKKENRIERQEHFTKYGYKCLVIWEHELKDLPKLKKKILKFHNG